MRNTLSLRLSSSIFREKVCFFFAKLLLLYCWLELFCTRVYLRHSTSFTSSSHLILSQMRLREGKKGNWLKIKRVVVLWFPSFFIWQILIIKIGWRRMSSNYKTYRVILETDISLYSFSQDLIHYPILYDEQMDVVSKHLVLNIRLFFYL